MSDAVPPFKRRRVDGAVHRPFKPPMRTPLKSTSKQPSNTLLVAQSPLQKYSLPDNADIENVPPDTSIPIPARKNQFTPSGVRSIGRPSKAAIPGASQNPQVQRMRDLEAKIRTLKRNNDQLKQAITIIKSSKDSELERLIEKWRAASRLAAEDVYGAARDKVNRMGGVEGLREQEKHTKDLRRQWEQEDQEYQIEKKIKELKEMVEAGEACKDDLQRFISQSKEKPEEQYMEDDSTEPESNRNVAKDEDGYTMGMMLRDMRIDFDTIGYNSRHNCWE